MTLYLLGVGLSVATLWWLFRCVGARRLVGIVLVVGIASLGIGWASDRALPPVVETDPDMNALESLSRHDILAPAVDTIFREAGSAIGKSWSPAVLLVLLLFVAGLLLRRLGVEPLRAARTRSSEEAGRPSPRWHGLAAGASAATVLSILLAYAYYPPVDQLFADMNVVRANALIELRTGHAATSPAELDRWDRLVGKLLISAQMRGTFPAQSAVDSTAELRQALRITREAATNGSLRDASAAARDLDEAYQRCRAAYIAV